MRKIKIKIWNLLNKLGFKLCRSIEGNICFKLGITRRQNTAYNDEKRNWVHLCDECHKYNELHWKDQWDEYYSSSVGYVKR